ncbi:Alpha-L-rhamnosidase N-terminal domain-containing protein [Paenibacillus sp. UNCCL117]|uniref:family 78 glycoside hydrolase catalytic domain n=1 Tax=unclassified Paenibacillus TaxID=185978 RepID=UPI000887529D|nr:MULTISPECIES: family 78 glycoside hydrolase catalytic domain [unclassified Paenibacillus]SDE36890.1 Alpha-L-rhamnosidase N-terminal domain-containing protein [Paenibacillus sp. cl123]SFW64842.1 Alpha-L-rhamnosidase N-terminal domain-containing protein [Paenibacillus sp. UNCCL117]
MEKNWQASWIRHPDFECTVPLAMLHKEMAVKPDSLHPPKLRNHHALFRRSVDLSAANLQGEVWLDISADDYYKLHINGTFVAQGPAQGYPFHYYYNRLDIRTYVRAGTNVIAVHVYYQGLVNRAYNSGDLRQGLIAELWAAEAGTARDAILLAATDAGWSCVRTLEYGSWEAPATGYDTQYLEHADSRLAYRGWRSPGFDDTGWQAAAEQNPAEAGYVLKVQPTPPVEVYRKDPAAVRLIGPGHYAIDFGEEITGQFTMKAQGEAGDVIEIFCGEELNGAWPAGDRQDESGKGAAEEQGMEILVRYDMRCNCSYRERWTLSGEEDVLELFEYKAFRYVEVIGPPRALDERHFAAVVRHYPLIDGTAGRFRSDDGLLDGIWDICARAVRNCAQESYVDCPSREKGQYLGDNTVIGHSHLYVSGDPRMVKKALRDFALSTAVCPGMMAVAPGNFMQEIADFSCQWPMQLLTYYRHTGDLAFLREMLPYADGIVAYFRQFSRSDCLLENVKEKWNLVDWPENLRDGYDFPLTRPVGNGCHQVINALFYGCVKTGQQIKDVLGIPYEDELPALRSAFAAAFYRPDTRLFADSEHSGHSSLHACVFPLLFDLAPAEAVPALVAEIRRKRFSCGVYMAYFVLKALAHAGEHALAYELITGEDERSWSQMLREGATSCFEAWGKEQKWNTSLCHAWGSAPIPVLIEDIIGLKPAEPGWKDVFFEPRLPADMQPFALSISVPSGIVEVRYDGTGAAPELLLPPGVAQRMGR